MAASSMTSPDKVRWIFDLFDANGDGGLDRSEIAALISAVNPTAQFTPDQIDAIGDEVFRSYADFIPDPSVGLTLLGLLQTYDDGAGDVDRDFSVLYSRFPIAGANAVPNPEPNPTTIIAPRWALSPNNGIAYEATWKLLEDLEILIKTRIRATDSKRKVTDSSLIDMSSESLWSTDLDQKRELREEDSVESRVFLKELNELKARVDRASTREERFDGHMAIGRTLYDGRIFKQALQSFQRAVELKPSDAQPQYWLGNTLFSLGKTTEAQGSYLQALELVESESFRYSSLLPQIHVNLGIVVEGDGLLINAIEHYREASKLCPTHYRALKLLGSALFGAGEFGSAVKALEEAVLLKPDYADAHCDLGSALHAMGEDERAVLAFQQAIDLKHDHIEASYNLGSLFNDVGRYGRAAEMYGRVIATQPDHWRAQVNLAVSLLGSGETEEAKIALDEALKASSRIELHDAISNLKQLQRKPKEGGGVNWLIVEASKFGCVNEKTTSREELSDALYIRAIQKATKLCCCNVTLLIKGMERTEAPTVSHSSTSNPERSTPKATVEIILRKLLNSLQPTTFQGATKAINKMIWAVLDVTGSGRIDLGMFFAVIAPLCAGPLEKRKRAAFDALVWRSSNTEEVRGHIDKADVSMYMRYIRVIYFPTRSFSDLMKANGSGEESGKRISYHDFIGILDGMDWGFSILSTLVKLEAGDRSRKGYNRSCAVCRYPIVGLIFRETSGFRLCASCYSEGRVPSAFQKEQYKFKESLRE